MEAPVGGAQILSLPHHFGQQWLGVRTYARIDKQEKCEGTHASA